MPRASHGEEDTASSGAGQARILVQTAHIPDPSGGTKVDAEARAAVNAILVALEGKGLVAEG
ncbi:MAG: hypothetical protein H6827_10665 [Planctomycetes bacterium]|nr:hypothetical protein [Planctomycetota bacterium]